MNREKQTILMLIEYINKLEFKLTPSTIPGWIRKGPRVPTCLTRELEDIKNFLLYEENPNSESEK